MKYKINLVILLVMLGFSGLQAQVTQEWVARYNGPGNSDDLPAKIVIDGEGNVYITGYSTGSGTGLDFATIKYNSSGVQQWVAKYNSTADDEVASVGVDALGNVYVTGFSYGSYSVMVTIKYNSSGIQQWIQTSDYHAGANSLAIGSSGNVYVTGWSNLNGHAADITTIKYNSSGIQQWIQIYDGPGHFVDEANAILLDNLENVFITGYISNNLSGSEDYATIKYDSSGAQQWIETYHDPSGSNVNEASALAVDNSGNVYVTGYTTNTLGTMYQTIKYNISGVQLWVQTYNFPGYLSTASSIVVANSGNVCVTGQSYINGTSTSDCATVQYNSSGIEQWVQRLSGSGNSLAVDSSGNIYVTGNGTLKYNSSGIQQWIESYNIFGGTSIVVGSSGNVYVTGYSIGSGTGLDFTTIKYSQLTGVQNISSDIPNDYSLSQNYPNPFNPKTIISYQLPMNNFVSLKIYDILGNEIATLVNEKQNAGTYSVDWDAGNFSSGVYFYKLQAGDFVETKRMTLIK